MRNLTWSFCLAAILSCAATPHAEENNNNHWDEATTFGQQGKEETFKGW